nr:DUF397 domain-containing protein [Kibdelosporangium sp. MJ126-NF4]
MSADRPDQEGNPKTTSSGFTEATWRKSSRSADVGQCVELARTEAGFGVRDSKNATGPVLTLTAEQGLAFLRSVKSARLS